MSDDDLHLHLICWLGLYGGDLHFRLVEALETWHEEHGTRRGKRTAWRQAWLACLHFCDGYSVREAARRVGCSHTQAGRDVEFVGGFLTDLWGSRGRVSARDVSELLAA